MSTTLEPRPDPGASPVGPGFESRTAVKRLYAVLERRLALAIGLSFSDLQRALRSAGAKVMDSGEAYDGHARCARCRRRIKRLYPMDGKVYGERCYQRIQTLEALTNTEWTPEKWDQLEVVDGR